MMSRKLHFLFFVVSLVALLYTCNLCYAQKLYYNQQPAFLKGNSVWIWGQGNGVDFNTSPPTPLSTTGTGATVWGYSSVADTGTGALLFYTDGKQCWNANNQVMPNGSGLLGNQRDGIIQGSCIVPVIGSPQKYYVFSLYGNSAAFLSTMPPAGSLFYSVVDMSLNGGLGDIEQGQKNISISNEQLGQAMIAVPGNNCDIWLLVHAYINPEFKAYHITTQGVDPVPVVSITGTQIQGIFGGIGAYCNGGMAVSPDRSKVAMSSFGSMSNNCTGLLLCKFDANSGTVSDGMRLHNIACMTPAFSPDNTKLYTIPNANYTGGRSYIWQYNVSSGDSATIVNSRNVVTQSLCSFSTPICLYNNVVYAECLFLHCNIPPSVSAIVNPNQSGPASGFQERYLTLAPTAYYRALPNQVVYPMPPDTTTNSTLNKDTLVCTIGGYFPPIELSALSGTGNYMWNDGSTTRTKKITIPGVYHVSYKELPTDCHYRRDSFIIRQSNISYTLGPDVAALCSNGDPYYLKVLTVPHATYRWQDGKEDSIYAVTKPGTYSVIVTNKDGCAVADTIKVDNKIRPDLGEDRTFCNRERIDITYSVTVSEIAKVQWSTEERSSSIVVREPGTYWVALKDPVCIESDTVHISKEYCDCFINVPTAFTPNADGLNDVFRIYLDPGCPVRNYQLNIYNRYGQRVFTSANIQDVWNGYQNGMPADVGTYFYELQFESSDHYYPFYQKGDVTLLR